ncbi:MAG: glycerate-2-kinase family protein, partial [Patescibacteria group bacterium]
MKNIINFKNLAVNSFRKKALKIAEAGYEGINIEKIVSERIKIKDNLLKIGHTAFFDEKKNEIETNLDDFERIYIVGIGKGSALAITASAKILGKKLTGGIALDVNKLKSLKAYKLKTFVGTHPLPSKQNIKATQEIIKLAKSLTGKDLLIAFICGGGSALACASKEELKNSVLAIKELTKAGANINELNTVRKHLSEFKGGGLAKMACSATIISLIVSDVCGNDLSDVASGPTVFDKTAKKDAKKILKKYGLNPDKFNLYETPKAKPRIERSSTAGDENYFKNVKNILFACNQDAVMAMVSKAEELGFKPKIYSLAL